MRKEKDLLCKRIGSALKGLPRHKKIVLNRDMVQYASTHALGGGEWSIELHEGRDQWSPVIAEFAGLNGTRDGEEPTDLWAEVREWEADPQRGGAVHHILHWYTLPDGEVMTFHAILREVRKGNLHGLILSF